jgi:hypothetical protein
MGDGELRTSDIGLRVRVATTGVAVLGICLFMTVVFRGVLGLGQTLTLCTARVMDSSPSHVAPRQHHGAEQMAQNNLQAHKRRACYHAGQHIRREKPGSYTDMTPSLQLM